MGMKYYVWITRRPGIQLEDYDNWLCDNVINLYWTRSKNYKSVLYEFKHDFDAIWFWMVWR